MSKNTMKNSASTATVKGEKRTEAKGAKAQNTPTTTATSGNASATTVTTTTIDLRSSPSAVTANKVVHQKPDESKRKTCLDNLTACARSILKTPDVDGLLCWVLKLTQYELKDHLYTYLVEKGYNPIYADGYLYATGDIPVMLQAHMDTVHSSPATEIFVSNKGNVSSPQGIGGDDRCGIYTILSIIKQGYKPYILFTEDEEIGCVGAKKFVKDLDTYVDKPDIHFIVEIDRKGVDDSVFYECDNKDFETFINTYGFVSDFGSFSDICETAPAIGVAAVNLSSGYYNPHTLREYISLGDLGRVIDRVSAIVADASIGKTQKYEFVEAARKSGYNWFRCKGYVDDLDDGYEDYAGDEDDCFDGQSVQDNPLLTLGYAMDITGDGILLYDPETKRYFDYLEFDTYYYADIDGHVYALVDTTEYGYPVVKKTDYTPYTQTFSTFHPQFRDCEEVYICETV
jgi:hypothetical protein